MEQKIITANSAIDLNIKIIKAIADGWTPVGSHRVVEHHRQNRYSVLNTWTLKYNPNIHKRFVRINFCNKFTYLCVITLWQRKRNLLRLLWTRLLKPV